MTLTNAIGVIGLATVVAGGCTAARASTASLEGDTATAAPTAAAQAPTTTAPATHKPPPNAMGSATKAFQDRIVQYVSFHNNVEKMVPPLTETSDPAKISAREQALGAALIKSRPDAKPGDFFIKEYQPYLLGIINEDFGKRPLADRRALIVELPKGVKVEVNAVYPPVLPLATFPANLLKKLPELPPELEYRTVGRDLVLRDVKGNVVVDVVRNAFPIS